MPFEAATWAMIAAGTAAGSAVMGYQSAKDQAAGQKAMADYNAKVAEREAEQKQIAGATQAQEIRERNRRLMSSQRAGWAISGATSAGSPLLAMIETAEVGELDALTTQYNAQIGADRSLSEARGLRMQGKIASAAGKTRAAQSLLGGANDMANIGMNYKLKA